MENNIFAKMEPYSNSDVSDAIERIITNELFPQLCGYLYPQKTEKEIAKFLRSIKTISEFQQQFSHDMVTKILKATSNGVTYSGLENISDMQTKGHLFIANHRDIVLDSAIFQWVLSENKLPTTQITVGDNLMTKQLFIDLAKLNKMFTLTRGGSKIQMYKNAILHSEYIRNLITKKNESLWIAQRDGRTKDGNDKTQQGLIKMLIGTRTDLIPSLKELNIIPLSISYEFESCAKTKTIETYISSHSEYQKHEDEDMNSIMAGFLTFKGQIHINFGKNINPILEEIENHNLPNNEIVDIVVSELDKQIFTQYKLMSNNYIAFDIETNSNKFSANYTNDEKLKFKNYINNIINDIEIKNPDIEKILLGIYSNPLKNKSLDT
jgi:hypothetical protein